jgi:hypothetical protein
MSGVIDKSGQQWEHCSQCEQWVKFQNLRFDYSPRWPDHDKVDLCPKCDDNNAATRFLEQVTGVKFAYHSGEKNGRVG